MGQRHSSPTEAAQSSPCHNNNRDVDNDAPAEKRAVVTAAQGLPSENKVTGWLGRFQDTKRLAELGVASFLPATEYEEAVRIAKEAGKPLFVLFQEIPGCQTCTDFGSFVLRDALLVEAIEDLFVPVLVRNNERKGTADFSLLEQFSEPAWNNPVVRFINPNTGGDVIPRADGVWDPLSLKRRMVRALLASRIDVPSYLSRHLEWLSPDLCALTVSMSCFWSGEHQLGSLKGVVYTQCGFLSSQEVVTVWCDPSITSYEDLACEAFACEVSSIFPHSNEQRAALQASQSRNQWSIHSAIDKFGSCAPVSDQKHSLRRQAVLAALPLTPFQQTAVNASAKALRGDRKALSDLLSPRQLALWDLLQQLQRQQQNRTQLPVCPILQFPLAMNAKGARNVMQFTKDLDSHTAKLARVVCGSG